MLLPVKTFIPMLEKVTGEATLRDIQGRDSMTSMGNLPWEILTVKSGLMIPNPNPVLLVSVPRCPLSTAVFHRSYVSLLKM